MNPNKLVEVEVTVDFFAHNGVKYQKGDIALVPASVAFQCSDPVKCESSKGCPWPSRPWSGPAPSAIKNRYLVTIAPGAIETVIVPDCANMVRFGGCADCFFVDYGTAEVPAAINTAPLILDGTAPENMPDCRALSIDGCPITEIQIFNCDDGPAKVTLEWYC